MTTDSEPKEIHLLMTIFYEGVEVVNRVFEDEEVANQWMERQKKKNPKGRYRIDSLFLYDERAKELMNNDDRL